MRLVPGEQLRRRAPTGFLLEIEVRKRLPGRVADDEGLRVLLDGPGRRGAALGWHGTMIRAIRVTGADGRKTKV